MVVAAALVSPLGHRLGIFTLDAQDLTLQVNGATALVSYTAKGSRRRLLVWGRSTRSLRDRSCRRRRFGVITAAKAGNRAAAPSGRFIDRCRNTRSRHRRSSALWRAPRAGRDALGPQYQAWQRLLPHAWPTHGSRIGCDGIPSVALVWPGRVAQGVAELDVRWPVAGSLRAADLSGRTGLRNEDAIGEQARCVWTLRLYRHPQLRLRPDWRHDAGKVLHLPCMRVLLQLRASRRRRLRTMRLAAQPSATCTRHSHGAGRDARRAVGRCALARTTARRTPPTTRSSTISSERMTVPARAALTLPATGAADEAVPHSADGLAHQDSTELAEAVGRVAETRTSRAEAGRRRNAPNAAPRSAGRSIRLDGGRGREGPREAPPWNAAGGWTRPGAPRSVTVPPRHGALGVVRRDKSRLVTTALCRAEPGYEQPQATAASLLWNPVQRGGATRRRVVLNPPHARLAESATIRSAPTSAGRRNRQGRP